MKKKLLSILITVTMLALCACGGTGKEPQGNSQAQESGKDAEENSSNAEDPGNGTAKSDGDTTENGGSAEEPRSGAAAADGKLTMTDPSGAKITVPEQINSIVVLAPSLSEIVTALGMGDKVTGYDIYSANVEGLPEGVPTFEITNPDMEQLAALAPDLLLVTNETLYDQESPYQALTDAGTCVICVPNPDDIAGIKSDMEFLATALGASEAGSALLDDFNAQLKELADIAAKIPQEERKRVYFEVAPAPNMYSFGNGVFLNEMIEWIGAKNILADQQGWMTIEGETIVAANPDAIFTNANYMEDPVQEILSRDGWAGITAVADKNVHCIDSNASSQPNHNIIKAMRQMAEILYPDYFTAK